MRAALLPDGMIEWQTPEIGGDRNGAAVHFHHPAIALEFRQEQVEILGPDDEIDSPGKIRFLEEGKIVGTFSYMSPESRRKARRGGCAVGHLLVIGISVYMNSSGVTGL